MRFLRLSFLWPVLLLLVWFSPVAMAEVVQVAVAANFSKPMQQIANAFNAASGHEAKLSFGSSGKFVAQISYGAPFDVFLSADTEMPKKLVELGLADAETIFTYAQGQLALWSADAAYISDDTSASEKVLKTADFHYLAMAEPRLAPYGRAAQEVLENLGLTDSLRERLVTGENISQAYQFVSTSNAELGFVAVSQIFTAAKLHSGSVWLIPQIYYQPIRQDAVLLKHGRNNVAARELLVFLHSDEAVSIMQEFGYMLPEPQAD